MAEEADQARGEGAEDDLEKENGLRAVAEETVDEGDEGRVAGASLGGGGKGRGGGGFAVDAVAGEVEAEAVVGWRIDVSEGEGR